MLTKKWQLVKKCENFEKMEMTVKECSQKRTKIREIKCKWTQNISVGRESDNFQNLI